MIDFGYVHNERQIISTLLIDLMKRNDPILNNYIINSISNLSNYEVVNGKDAFGNNLMHLACFSKNYKLMSFLESYGLSYYTSNYNNVKPVELSFSNIYNDYEFYGIFKYFRSSLNNNNEESLNILNYYTCVNKLNYVNFILNNINFKSFKSYKNGDLFYDLLSKIIVNEDSKYFSSNSKDVLIIINTLFSKYYENAMSIKDVEDIERMIVNNKNNNLYELFLLVKDKIILSRLDFLNKKIDESVATKKSKKL